MKIFNLFKKKSTKIKEKNEDNLKFFYKDLSEKYSITETEAFLLITQALFAYHPFDIYKVRNLELNLSEKNIETYNQEKINLDKIHRLFLFFGTTRTHELKNKYKEWIKEYYDKYKKPIFRAGERSKILPDAYFIEFIYEKILEWQK